MTTYSWISAQLRTTDSTCRLFGECIKFQIEPALSASDTQNPIREETWDE